MVEAADSERKLAAIERLLERCEGSADPGDRSALARGYYDKGALLRDIGRTDEALQAWDEVVTRLGSDSLPGAEQLPLDALYNQANLLLRQGRPAEAVAACDALINRYSNDVTPYVMITVGQAMGMRLYALITADSREPALAAASELLARFGDRTEPELRPEIIRALEARIVVECRAGRRRAAIAASQDLMAQFEQQPDAARKAIIGEALRYAAVALLDLKRSGPVSTLPIGRSRANRNQAFKILEFLRDRLRGTEDPDLQRLLVRVLLDSGEFLAAAGRIPQAVALFEQTYDLGEPALAILQERVAKELTRSRTRLALLLAGEVAVLQQLERWQEADAKMNEIIQQFKDDNSPLLKFIVFRARRDQGGRA